MDTWRYLEEVENWPLYYYSVIFLEEVIPKVLGFYLIFKKRWWLKKIQLNWRRKKTWKRSKFRRKNGCRQACQLHLVGCRHDLSIARYREEQAAQSVDRQHPLSTERHTCRHAWEGWRQPLVKSDSGFFFLTRSSFFSDGLRIKLNFYVMKICF